MNDLVLALLCLTGFVCWIGIFIWLASKLLTRWIMKDIKRDVIDRIFDPIGDEMTGEEVNNGTS